MFTEIHGHFAEAVQSNSYFFFFTSWAFCGGCSVQFLFLFFTCSTYGEGRKCVESFDGETKETRPLGRCKHRWEDNIKMSLKKIVWELVEWIHQAQYRKN